MTAKIIDGKKLASKYLLKLATEIESIKAKYKKTPKLSVILVGDDPASIIYTSNKTKRAKSIGMNSELITLPKTITEKELLKIINKLNKDKKTNGILVQLPLPSHIEKYKVINSINPEKDVDGFHPVNKGLLSMGMETLTPCTPLGIMKMLEFYKIKIEGKTAVVLGRSDIVGKPIANLLLNHNATVTNCHSKTKDLKAITNKADILISAMGVKPYFIDESYIKQGATVIDVAMIRDTTNNCWLGDIDFKSASKKAAYITPVPGGVGPMTITMLMNNTISAFCTQHKIERNTL